MRALPEQAAAASSEDPRLGQERDLDGASYAYMHLPDGVHRLPRTPIVGTSLHVATQIPHLEATPRSTDSAATVPPAARIRDSRKRGASCQNSPESICSRSSSR